MKYLVLLALLSVPTFTWATSDVSVSFTQIDCEYVDHWNVYIDGVYYVEVVPPCAELMSAPVTILGVGNKFVKMTAVAPDGTESAYSNELGTLIPLAAPSLVSVD